jgi:dTDP-4-amino-4,6-dideoxygalactose transaminase|tara:strand:+ start:870 stop:1952 length:1083 start_codon:yes stop_codon:yes gene_type:complete
LSKQIKLFDPVINDDEVKAAVKVLKSRFWASGSGTGNVKKFERIFNKYIGSQNSLAVNSGTAALHLALSLCNIKNKEVILPSLSFVSTAHAVMYNGGKPIFADVDPTTLNIDPTSISDKISKNTKVILPVHFGGLSCDLNFIQKLCKDSDIFLIEDAAHATGSLYKGKKIGTHGSIVCFSFHPVKNLAMPTGGALSLNGKNSEHFEKSIRSLRWCGISNRKGVDYDVSRLGWNYYMNEVSAAIGLEQLKKLDNLISIKRNIAKRYSDELSVEKMPFDEDCSYHMFWIRVKKRKQFMQKMTRIGIETGIHYKPIHKMTFYNSKQRLPNTESISDELVSIPIHANLSDFSVSKIIKYVNKFS